MFESLKFVVLVTFCLTVTKKKMFHKKQLEGRVCFGLQFQSIQFIISGRCSDRISTPLITLQHSAEAGRENMKWGKAKSFQSRPSVIYLVSQAPPPKGSVIFSNNATNWEPRAQTHETMGGYFSFEPQHPHVQKGSLAVP